MPRSVALLARCRLNRPRLNCITTAAAATITMPTTATTLTTITTITTTTTTTAIKLRRRHRLLLLPVLRYHRHCLEQALPCERHRRRLQPKAIVVRTTAVGGNLPGSRYTHANVCMSRRPRASCADSSCWSAFQQGSCESFEQVAAGLLRLVALDDTAYCSDFSALSLVSFGMFLVQLASKYPSVIVSTTAHISSAQSQQSGVPEETWDSDDE